MPDPLDADVAKVPPSGRHQLVMGDGRTFAASHEDGQMTQPTHGLVHDDRRYVSRLMCELVDAHVDLLSASPTTPLSGVIVSQLTSTVREQRKAVLIRRRWL